MPGHSVRAVKETDSKSIRLFPRGFESHRCVLFLGTGSARRGSNPLAVGVACLWVLVGSARQITITMWKSMTKGMYTPGLFVCCDADDKLSKINAGDRNQHGKWIDLLELVISLAYSHNMRIGAPFAQVAPNLNRFGHTGD